MKYNRKTHLTERQLRDLSGLTVDAIRVRAKTDPKFPEALFVNNEHQMVYDKEQALEWITWMSYKKEHPLEVVPARQPKPLSKQGEYKPSIAMQINMKRTAKVYQRPLITPNGIGNKHNLGGHYDA